MVPVYVMFVLIVLFIIHGRFDLKIRVLVVFRPIALKESEVCEHTQLKSFYEKGNLLERAK